MTEPIAKLDPGTCLCGGTRFHLVFHYNRAPEGEMRYSFSSGDRYYREIHRCDACGHYVSVHAMDASKLYEEDYVQSTYGDAAGIRHAFDRINGLDPSRSDNAGRVRRILEFARSHFPEDRFQGRSPSLLDVGSGLCVFAHRMKAAGWDCTALDPDERSAAHASEVVGVSALCGDFLTLREAGPFDLITLNKVLEHVEDPVTLLARTAGFLREGGFVYVEVPDGEMASSEGAEREEFMIDHFHVFSLASMELLAARANLSVLSVERVREPSTKFTIRGFLSAGPGEGGS